MLAFILLITAPNGIGGTMNRNRWASWWFALMSLGGSLAYAGTAAGAAAGPSSPKADARQEAAKQSFIAGLRRTLSLRLDSLQKTLQQSVDRGEMSARAAKRAVAAHVEDLGRFDVALDKAARAHGGDAAPDLVARTFVKHFHGVQNAQIAAAELDAMSRHERRRSVMARKQAGDESDDGVGDALAAKQSSIHTQVLRAAVNRLDVKAGAARAQQVADALQRPLGETREAIEKLGYVAPSKLPARIAQGLAVAKARLSASPSTDTEEARRKLNVHADSVLIPAAAQRRVRNESRAAKQDAVVGFMTHALNKLDGDHLANSVMSSADDYGSRATAQLLKRALGKAVAENAANRRRRPLQRAEREVAMRSFATELSKDLRIREATEAPRIDP
jgi:hypothetical protein